MYFKSVLTTRIALNPADLSSNYESVLNDNVKSVLEGRCIKDGLVVPGTVSILKRSLGRCGRNGLTNGSIIYDLVCIANICNPKQGDQIAMKVLKLNKIGLLGESINREVECIVVKQHHEHKEIFGQVDEGDYLLCEIVGSKMDLHDTRIKSICKIIKKMTPAELAEYRDKIALFTKPAFADKATVDSIDAAIAESDDEYPESEPDENAEPVSDMPSSISGLSRPSNIEEADDIANPPPVAEPEVKEVTVTAPAKIAEIMEATAADTASTATVSTTSTKASKKSTKSKASASTAPAETETAVAQSVASSSKSAMELSNEFVYLPYDDKIADHFDSILKKGKLSSENTANVLIVGNLLAKQIQDIASIAALKSSQITVFGKADSDLKAENVQFVNQSALAASSKKYNLIVLFNIFHSIEPALYKDLHALIVKASTNDTFVLITEPKMDEPRDYYKFATHCLLSLPIDKVLPLRAVPNDEIIKQVKSTFTVVELVKVYKMDLTILAKIKESTFSQTGLGTMSGIKFSTDKANVMEWFESLDEENREEVLTLLYAKKGSTSGTYFKKVAKTLLKSKKDSDFIGLLYK